MKYREEGDGVCLSSLQMMFLLGSMNRKEIVLKKRELDGDRPVYEPKGMHIHELINAKRRWRTRFYGGLGQMSITPGLHILKHRSRFDCIKKNRDGERWFGLFRGCLDLHLFLG